MEIVEQQSRGSNILKEKNEYREEKTQKKKTKNQRASR